jgi:Ca-activated chloride channel homolog
LPLFRFEHIEFLLALVLDPVLVFLFWNMLRWKKNTVKKMGDEHLVKKLIMGYSPKRFLAKFLLVITAFVLTGLGVANLQYPRQVEQVNRKGIDVMIALDVSRSMLAEDVKPNRLERARQLINRLMDRLPNDRIGLVLFAGRAYLQMPLTTDHGAARIYVNSATPESVPTQGTVIGEALAMCRNAFEKKEKKFKTVVLITDGEDHDENALQAAKELSESGVLIHTIGTGTSQGAQIMDPVTKEPKKDAMGNTVITRLNEPELLQIAQAGNGVYQLLVDTDDTIKKILEQIAGMERKSITDNSFINYRSFFQWFLAVALVLLIAEIFLSERSRQKA